MNRHICDVFQEMRKSFETYNFAAMLSQIEEAQSMANRMEAALCEQKDLRRLQAERKELTKEVKKLRKQRDKLAGKKEDDE